MSNPKIYDSFPYNGEKLVLDIRLHELNDIITSFIIVESNRTQTGLPKPYYFEEQRKYFKDFLDKITYIKLDDSNVNGVKEADWSQEFSVREAIMTKGLQQIQNSGVKLYQDDYLLINDLDEVPRRDVVYDQVYNKKVDIVALNHYFNSYYLNWYSEYRNWGWYGTVISRLSLFRDPKLTIQWLRNIKDGLIHNGESGEGWHFSNLLANGFETMYKKWCDNIEPHDKSCLKNKELLMEQFNKCVFEEKQFFFCDLPEKREIGFKNLPLDKLPLYVQNDLSKFKNLIHD